MKIYTFTENDISIDHTCISADAADILYFDIETTGLSAGRSDLYMIGCGEYKNGSWTTTLLFNDDGTSEPELLERFLAIAAGHSCLVTYNGDTFDIPYINEKFRQFGISSDISSMTSIDLYRIIRRYKGLLSLSSARQKDIEALVRFKRNTFISRGDLIAEYRQYLKGRSSGHVDAGLSEDLLIHNHDDIRGLISITEFARLPHIGDASSLTDVSFDGTYVYYTCRIPQLPCHISAVSSGILLNADGSRLTVRVPVVSTAMKYFFKNYRDYYYLPLEGTAIHKSVAAYVDKEHKEKATRNTAFTTKTSHFIPSVRGFEADLFYDTDLKGSSYIELTEQLTFTSEAASSYVRLIISSFL